MWCVLLGAMLASCGREKVMSGPGSPADSVAGISSDAFDSLLLYSGTEPGEEELPANADELFDDFVFEFSRLKKFQVSRVVFPFPVVASRADTTWIAKAQWRHADLFGGGDYYTVFFNEEEQMELEKSTDLDHVDMDWILLKEHRFRTFHFERRGGKWMLVEESLHALEESPLAGFLDFYGRFVADADFQARSVSDPLRYVTTDPDDDFARFHANQGLIVLLVSVIGGAVLGILTMLPVVGLVFTILSSLFGVVMLVACIFGILNVVREEKRELPVIGKFTIIK